MQLADIKNLTVIGGKQCEAVTRTPDDGETFKIGESITVKAIYTPCHTQDSICWLMEDESDKVVFTGDTLFTGGYKNSRLQIKLRTSLIATACGRFFEGTPEEMHKALNEKLAALPDETRVYVGLLVSEC